MELESGGIESKFKVGQDKVKVRVSMPVCGAARTFLIQ